jgi:hypothetical protein
LQHDAAAVHITQKQRSEKSTRPISPLRVNLVSLEPTQTQFAAKAVLRPIAENGVFSEELDE